MTDKTLLDNSKSVTKNHMISSISYCILVDDLGNEISVVGIQATLSVYKNQSWVDPIALQYFGATNLIGLTQCGTWQVPPGQVIDEISV